MKPPYGGTARIICHKDPLAEEILKGNLHAGEPIIVTSDKQKLVFNQTAAAAGALSS